MRAKIIKELSNFKGKACLVKFKNKFYAISSLLIAFDTGMPETLVFPCDKNGENINFSDVAGGRGMNR